jgi:Leucine-rich repeat (LRR) protein
MGITSLEGIEYFTALEYLSVEKNDLTSLDVSSLQSLTHLSCGNNKLEELDVSHNPSLEVIRCWRNKLTSLDLSNNPLVSYLDVRENNLPSKAAVLRKHDPEYFHFEPQNVLPMKEGTISLAPSKVVLYLGSMDDGLNLTVSVEGFDDYDESDVSFYSSAPSVCTADEEGFIKAVKKGSAVITAQLDAGEKIFTATCKVTVKKPSLKVSPTKLTLKKGKKASVSVSAVPAGTVTFKSSNKKIATVSAGGVVKGKKKGSAVIYVMTNGVTKKVKVKVTK